MKSMVDLRDRHDICSIGITLRKCERFKIILIKQKINVLVKSSVLDRVSAAQVRPIPRHEIAM